ncbi:MAG TPA: hypothetical protein VNE00_17965 [Paraburkholderia sp.]|nr:hypothetical protein [Paraburkholderia sp.]
MKTDATLPGRKGARPGVKNGVASGIANAVAQTNQIAELEELAALISQEMKQRVTATVIYAQAAARWLAATPPNLAEAHKALEGIVYNATRSNEIVDLACRSVTRGRHAAEDKSLAEAIKEVIDGFNSGTEPRP